MITIKFETPRTAMEIREPFIEATREVAEKLGIFAVFKQNSQPALSGNPGDSDRVRIGNHKHKNWYANYQEEQPSANKPTVLGKVVIASATIPSLLQFGGFSYDVPGPYIPLPTYRSVTIDMPADENRYRPVIPTPKMIELTHETVQKYLAAPEE